MWARIDNDVVAETTETDPTGRFHRSILWVPADANVRVGWSYVDGQFMSPPEATLEDLQTDCRAAVDGAVRRIRVADRLSYAGAEWEVSERAEQLVQRKAARVAASGTPTTITLYDVSGAGHALDQAQFADLVAAADDWLDALYAAASALRSKVDNLNRDDAAELLQSVQAADTLSALQALNDD